jgi:hypothetical protein
MAKHLFSTEAARNAGHQATTRTHTKNRDIPADEAKRYWVYVAKHLGALKNAVLTALKQGNAAAYRASYEHQGIGRNNMILDKYNDKDVDALTHITCDDDVFNAVAFLVLERGYLERYDATRSPDRDQYMLHMYKCAFGHILQAYMDDYARRRDIAEGGDGKYANTKAARKERMIKMQSVPDQVMAPTVKRAARKGDQELDPGSVGPMASVEAFGITTHCYEYHYSKGF